MSIKFKPIARKNLKAPNDPPKFYAIAESKGKTDIDALSKLVARESTVSRTDVYAVIMSLLDAVAYELNEGRSVMLGKLGSLSVSISSEGAVTAEELSSSAIRKARIVYRPGKELKKMLTTLDFEKKA